MSGLAAGVLGGAWVAELAGRRNVVTLDIGGTSADIGVVTDGHFAEASARDTFVAGYPILVPMIDLHTIGAGGGSIAHVDASGAFRVGPQSAGAVPGPAAYGQGGADATVTDANIVLGRIDVQNFLGGAMRLDRAAAFKAVQALADQLGMPLLEAAEGVVTVAKMLDIPEVIVPPYPGINSAIGLLTTDLKYDVVRTAFLVSTGVDLERLNADLAAMEETLRTQLAADGLDASTASIQRSADARYVGQGYDLRLELPPSRIGTAEFGAAHAAFHALHEREYGHHFAQSPVELVNLRVTAVAQVPKIRVPPKPAGGSLQAARLRTDDAVFRVGMELASFATTFYDRGKLPVGEPIPGPAIILQFDSTTVVPPQCTAEVHESGSIILKLPMESVS